MITGELVSAADYFGTFARDFRVGAGFNLAFGSEEARENFSGVFEKFEFLRKGEWGPFLHVRNARIVQSGVPQVPGVWWRGRVGAVDGFILGTLAAEPLATEEREAEE